MLLVALDESCEERPALVRLAVAVGVLSVKNFRRGGDQDTITPRENAGGKIQVVQEHGGLVIAAVAVGVFQHFDSTARHVAAPFRRREDFFATRRPRGRSRAGRRFHATERVIEHIDDPEPAIGAPVEGNGIL